MWVCVRRWSKVSPIPIPLSVFGNSRTSSLECQVENLYEIYNPCLVETIWSVVASEYFQPEVHVYSRKKTGRTRLWAATADSWLPDFKPWTSLFLWTSYWRQTHVSDTTFCRKARQDKAAESRTKKAEVVVVKIKVLARLFSWWTGYFFKVEDPFCRTLHPISSPIIHSHHSPINLKYSN